MRKLFITFSLTFSMLISIFAQESGISLEIHYPIVIADPSNFSSEISGLFGANFLFQFSNNEMIDYGIKYTFDQIQTQQSIYNNNQINKYNFVMSHIDGFGVIDLNSQKNLKANIEGGISFYKYQKSTTQPGYFGFNAGTGLNYEFERRFYAFLHYNFIRTSRNEKQTDYVKIEKIQAFRIGIGLKL